MRRLIGQTDTGKMRESNQDRFAVETLSPSLSFAVVCDGMGGQNGGNVASETVTKFVSEMLRRDLRQEMSELSLRSVMMSALAGANAAVYDAAQKDPSLVGMGTTAVIAVFLGSELFVSYVGDSRVYVVSHQQELQLTKDHTVVQMLVDIGQISQSDAKSHPKRHYITRAVGVGEQVEADFLVHSLQPGELVLLCSDGLYNYMDLGSFYPLLEQCAQQQTVQPLIDLANEKGGSDNITAVLACPTEQDAEL